MKESPSGKFNKKVKQAGAAVVGAVVFLLFLQNASKEIQNEIGNSKTTAKKSKQLDENLENVNREIASEGRAQEYYNEVNKNYNNPSYEEAVSVTQEPESTLTSGISANITGQRNAASSSTLGDTSGSSSESREPSSSADSKNKSKNDTNSTNDKEISQTYTGGGPTTSTNPTTTTTTNSPTPSTPPVVITPNIVSVTTTLADNTYTTGQVVDIILTFDQIVNTSSSFLTLDNAATATYFSGTGTTAITYQYIAAGGEDTTDLNVSSIDVGDALSSTSAAPNTSIPSGQNLADLHGIVIDTTAPTIVSISSSDANGRYTNTNTINITVTFDEVINLTNSSLTLDTGGTATYSTGNGSTTLTYIYTVGAGENSADLNVTAFAPGDALDIVSIAPNTTLPATNNLADNKALVVDNQAASILNITGTNGTYTNTDIVDITVTFDEAVNTSTSTLSLDNGASAVYQSGSGTAAIVYRYTVGPSPTEDSSDLSVTSFNIGNTADLVGIVVNTAIPAGQNLADLRNIIIDNTAAQITNITSLKANGTYTIGEVIDIDVTFDEVITTSTSTLTLDTTGVAVYESGSGSNTITYRYTVGTGHNSADLNVTTFNALDAVDPAGITPDATIPASDLAANKAIVIDTNQATITNIESITPGNGTYNAGDTIDIVVTFNEAITTSNSSLTLDTGGTAIYSSGSTTSAITYTYTVLPSHTSSDLNVTTFNIGDAADGVSLAPDSTLPTGIAGSGNLATNNNIIIDTTAPTVTQVYSPDSDGSYGIGQMIRIHVDFSEAIFVTGTPQITLNSGAVVDYVSGSGGATLVFEYIVGITESSSDLDYSATNSLALNSGTILDNGGNAADLTLASPNSSNSISDDQAIVIDGVVPTISNVTSDKADGTYGIGEDIDIQITFSEIVDVSGTPTLDLNSGGSASYLSGTGSTVLTFRYSVLATENTTDLNYITTGDLNLSGGTIQDIVNNNADLTLPTVLGANSLGTQKNIVIDTTAPTITNVTSVVNADGTYGIGQVISVQVTFSEAMTVDTGSGTPSLLLETGTTDRNAVYVSGSGTANLVFNYTVVSGDSSLDLEYVNTSSLVLNGGTIRDAGLNDGVLTLPTIGGGNSLSDNKAIVIDTDGASVAQVYSSKGDGSYTVGEVIDIFVEFSELVNVTGTPQLTLNSGAVVDYTSGSASNTLLFQYTVGTGDNSADLDYALISSLALNGGTIEDAVNNAATLTLPTPNALNSISDDKAIVIDTQGPQIISISSTEADGTYGLGATIDIEITFDENVTVNTGGGTPTLAVNAGTGVASYVSTASNVITLTYTVGAGEDSADLDYDNISSFVLNGGTIVDALANNASLVIPAVPGTVNSISDDQAIVIDTTAPTVTQVYSDKADGTYGATEVINVYVEFSEVVNVAIATPEITLNSSATPVSYTSGSGTNTLLFTYTVGATDNSTDLDYVNTTSLDINGATIRDIALNDATLTLATPNDPNSISDDKAIIIDTNVASITNITSTKANGVYQSPEVIYIDVTFDELINTSTSTLTLNTGATAAYDSQSGTSTIRYIYTVGAGESTEDLDVTAFNIGDTADAGGNPPSTGLPAGQNLADNKQIAIADALLTLDIYVRPTATGNADSCDVSPNPSLCYNSLSDVNGSVVSDSALTDKDLVTQNVEILVHIQGDWSTAPGGVDDDLVVLSGWTSDATHFITIQTEGVARHNGTANCTTCYILDPSVGGAHGLNITNSADYTVVDGLIITGLEDSALRYGLVLNGNGATARNMIIHNMHPASGDNGAILFNTSDTGHEIFIENTLVYGNDFHGILIYSYAAVPNVTVHIRNSAIVSGRAMSRAIRFTGDATHDYSTSNVEIVNTYMSVLGEVVNIDGSVTSDPTWVGSSNVLSSDDDAQTVIGLDNTNSAINVQLTDIAAAPTSYDGNKYVIVNETTGAIDFHLANNALNLALAGGADLSATIPNDIDNAVITPAQYQIGPDFIADSTGPIVNEVYITETDGVTIKPDGAYGNAATMSFIIEFSQLINVTGTPQLTHNASVTPVNCIKDPTRWNALKCDYTVGATDTNLDLDFVSTASLALNGGTINDRAGNAANLTLPTPTALYSASDNQDIIINAGALTLDIYVREDCTGAPGQCYTALGDVDGNIVTDTSLADKDLVTQNVSIIVHIDQAWTGPDTSVASLNGWTTDATHFLTIQTEGAARHNGTPNNVGAYKLDPNTSLTSITVGAGVDYTVIDGLVITGLEAGVNLAGIYILANQTKITNSIIYDLHPSPTGLSAIYIEANNSETWVENTLIYGKAECGICFYDSSNTPNIDVNIHNSFINTEYATGMAVGAYGTDISGSNLEIVNTVLNAISSSNDAVYFYGATPATFTGSTNVLTGDDTAQTVIGLNDTNSAINVQIVDVAAAPSVFDGNKYVIIAETLTGSEDYHLIDNSLNLALGSGYDLSATIANDIDGAVITPTQYQIGPDFIADTTGPIVYQVYITDQTDGSTLKPDASYAAGATMSFIIEFSQVLNVTGTPQLTHNASATPANCVIHPTKWNALKCDYTVLAGDLSADLDYANTTALALNSGTITDKAGNAANLTLVAPNAIYSASDDQAIVIDAVGPTITLVNSVEADGFYNASEDSLEIQVIFDEPISVSGSPTLDLETGTTDRTATFLRVDSGNIAVFSYDVIAGDSNPDLDYIATTSLSLNGGTIQDSLGNNADLTLATPGAVNSLGNSNSLVIDAIAPTITSIESTTPDDGTYSSGSIDIQVTFSEALQFGNSSSLTLDNGKSAVYLSGLPSLVATYRYTIGTGGSDDTADLTVTAFNNGNAADYAGNTVNTTLPATANLGDNNDIIIDTTQPTVVEVKSSTADGTYSTGETISIEVVFSEIVDVVGTPQIALNSSATVDYTSGTGSNTLIFSYVVQSGDVSADLDYVATNSLTLNGGTIQDGAYLDADLTLAAPNATNSISDDKAIVIASDPPLITNITSAKADGFYSSPEIIDITVTFDNSVTTSTSELVLDTGSTAVYQSGSGSNTIIYRYIVSGGDTSFDLNVTSITAGDAVLTSTAIGINTTLPSGQNLADNKAIVINDGLLTLDIYVREDCSGAPGTCYTSLSSVDGSIVADTYLADKDLVTQNTNVVIHIDQAWTGPDTSRSTFDNWITDATHFVTIQTEGAARHNGVATCANCYRIDPSSGGSAALFMADVAFAVVDGLIITGMEDTYPAIYLNADEVKLKNTIIHDLHPTNGTAAIIVSYNNLEVWIQNCLIYGNIQYGITVYNNSAASPNIDVHVHNTIVDIKHANARPFAVASNGTSDFANSNMEIINSGFFSNSAQPIFVEDNVAGSADYVGSQRVISKDNTAQTVLGLNSTNSIIGAIITDAALAPSSYDGNPYILVNETLAGSEDYHLVDSSYNSGFSGFDLSAFFDPDEDIDGDTITNWYHIGPDWVVDTSVPLIGSITSSKADGIYFNTEVIDIEVKFSEPVFSVLSSLTLDSGGTASYISGSGSASHIYRYTVSGSETSSDLTVTSFNSNGATDIAGNSLNTTLPTTLNLGDNKNIAIAAGLLNLDLYVREIASPGASSCAGAPNPSLCYTNLKAAIDSIVSDTALASKNLVAQNSTISVHIQEAWASVDPSNVIINGYTTDATHNISIQTEGVARHSGDTSCVGTCYVMDPSVGGEIIQIGVADLETDTAYTSIDGIIMTGTEAHFNSGIYINADKTRVSNVIMYDFIPPTSNNHGGWGIRIHSDNTETWIENVLMYGDVARFIVITSSTALPVADPMNIHIYNSLFHATNATAGRGILLDDNGAPTSSVNINFDIRNTAFLGSYVTGIYQNLFAGGPPTFTGSTNVLTSNTTAQSVFGLNDTNSAVNVLITDTPPGSFDGNKYVLITNDNPGTQNYHLLNNSFNIALSGGADTSSLVSEDIDGDLIPGVPNQIGPDYLFDTSSPVVTEVYATEANGVTLKSNGTYVVGNSISVVIEFSEFITLSGSPELTLNSSATPVSCAIHPSKANALKCDYTIGSGDSTADFDYLNTSSLDDNGADILDRAGNYAILILPVPNATYSISDNQAIEFNNVPPEVVITSAPAINDANKSAYTVSGTCNINGTNNVDVTVGGSVSDTVNCSGGTFSATLDVSSLGDAVISCPTDFVLVERNTTFTTENFCISRYEARNNASSISFNPTHAVWNFINRGSAETQCQSMGGTVDLLSNSQWQTVARNIELNPKNWYDGVIGGDGNVMVIGHSDNAPAAIQAISNIMDPYSDTSNNSSQGATTGWAQRRTHILSSGQEIWDLGGNVLEWVKDDFTSTASNANAVAITDVGTFTANAGFADVNDAKNIATQFGPQTDYSSWTLGGTSSGGYVGRIYAGSQNGIIRGGAYFSTNNGIFTAGVDYNDTALEGLRGFRCMSQVSSGYLVQADHRNSVPTTATDSVTVSKDTSTPAAPALTSPADSSSVVGFTQTITGTCITGTIVSLTGDILDSPVTRECIGGTYSIEVTFTPGDGTKNINITQTDLAGNTSSTDSNSIGVFSGATAISIAAMSPVNIANVASYSISGNCSPNAANIIDIDLGGVTQNNIDCTGGAWSTTINLTAALDSLNLAVTANYAPGPTATTSTTVLKDTIRPTALTVPTGVAVDSRVFTLTGNCEPNALVSVTGDVESSLAPYETTCPGGGTYTLDIAFTRNSGTKTIDIIETDLAGNSTSPVHTENFPYTRRAILSQTIATSNNGTCFLNTDGRVLCSGTRTHGYRGDSSSLVSGATTFTPDDIDMSGNTPSTNDFISINGAGSLSTGAHVCAVHSGGKGFCWGANGDGELGNGTTTTTSTPTEIDVSAITPSTNDWLQFGMSHNKAMTCGVHASTKIFCWGENTSGGIGNGTAGPSADFLTPQEIDMTATGYANTFSHVSVGDGFACGVHTNGRAFCWGEGSSGRLGINDATGTDHDTPQEVDMSSHGVYDNDFLMTGGGDDHMCGVHSSGKVFCWGDDESDGSAPGGSFGILGNGDGTDTDKAIPTEIYMTGTGEENDFKEVRSAGYQSCALHTTGKLFCWGRNDYGAVPVTGAVYGTDGTVQTPTEVKVSHLGKANNFIRFGLHSRNLCAEHNDGTLYCSGDFSKGAQATGSGGANTAELTAVDNSNF